MTSARDRVRGGFTLAELLIVVAILGVLAAVAVPVFAGTLDKTKAQVCAANRAMLTREILYARMTGASDKELNDQYQEAQITEKGYICPTNHHALTLHFEPVTHVFSVSCENVHGGGLADYNFAGTFEKYLENGVLTETILNSLKKFNRNWLPQIDSTVPNGGNYGGDILKCLKDATNYSLGEGMTKTWSVSRIDKKRDGSLSDYQLCWSSVDISSCSKGDQILMMRYDSKAETYSVVWATVDVKNIKIESTGSMTGNYNAVSEAKPTVISGSTSQDFAAAYSYFQEVLKEKGGVKPKS